MADSTRPNCTALEKEKGKLEVHKNDRRAKNRWLTKEWDSIMRLDSA
jgi:hypothetical protein